MGILRSDRVSGLGGANAIKGSVEMRGAQNLRAEIVNGNADFNLGSSDFTIECWYNPGGTTGTSNDLDVDLLMLWNNTNNRRSFGLYRDSSGSLGLIGSSDGTNSDMQSYHSYNFPDVNAWYHIAGVRISNTATVYVNGTSIGSATVSGSYYENTVDNLVVGGQLAGTSYDSKIARGFISNMRLIIGDGIYTGAFTPPANELTATSNTKLLCCQSPANILQEATGKTLIAHRSSANDSFAKASTFAPDKGEDYGTTFGDNTRFDTLSYMVPPGGTTTQSNRGRCIVSNGAPGTQALQYLQMQSGGIMQSFGNLANSAALSRGCGSSTRMLVADGYISPVSTNIIEYLTIATTSNGTNFGDLTVARRRALGMSNSTRGVWVGGSDTSPTPYLNTQDYNTIATLSDATDFGDASTLTSTGNGVSSSTRGVYSIAYNGSTSAYNNTLEYITFASTGSRTNFGDLNNAKGYHMCGCSSSDSTRGLFAGGYNPSNNNIDYITMASTGDATDFGDLSVARRSGMATGNSIDAVFMGGYIPGVNGTVDKVTIQTTGDAVNWGDLSGTAFHEGACSSDSHGGIS